MRYLLTAFSILSMLLGGCSSTAKQDKTATSTQSAPTPIPAKFDADSAYAFVQQQCSFGARVPGTEAHRRCGDYLESTLKSYGIDVETQSGKVTTFDGNVLNIRNIIAQINPDSANRILLLAHWDCRPWADKDPDPTKRNQPVMGANDAASGVGVLMEMARAMQKQKPNVGVDIILVDAEDWGDDNGGEDTWALGTQYWTRNMHRQGYRPMFGILLDMVGAEGATFYQEYYSLQYAHGVVQGIWKTAAQLGHGAMFISQPGGGITDDHVPVNKAGIPCIDIIDMRMESQYGFFDGWHTTDDVMTHISRSTLAAVGETLLTFIYSY